MLLVRGKIEHTHYSPRFVALEGSPLQSIQGNAIRDSTSDVFSSHPLTRYGSPRPRADRKPDWFRVPRATLYPKADDLVLQHVSIPTKSIYKPNAKTESQKFQLTAQTPVLGKDFRRKVIVSRHLLTSGHITFVIGTTFGGVVTREAKEIPLSEILNHVTYSELQRYENQEYLLEDEHEEQRPPPKTKGWPKGRPRKRPLADEATSRESTITPTAFIHGKRPLGRPRKVAVVVPRSSPATQTTVHRTPTNATHQKVTVRVPLIVTPQSQRLLPGQASATPVPKFSSPKDPASSQKSTRRPQYSMVAASGLEPSDSSSGEEASSQVLASRAESQDPLSLEEQSLPKRRRLAVDGNGSLCAASPSPGLRHGLHSSAYESNARTHRPRPGITPDNSKSQIDSDSDSNPEDTDHVDTLDVRDDEVEREALLRQFQISNASQSRQISVSQHVSQTTSGNQEPSVQAPRNAGKFRKTPDFSLKPIPTSDVFRTSSSNCPDNLIDPEIRIKGASSARPPTFHPQNVPKHVTTPRKAAQRRASLTPHFPHGKRLAPDILRGSPIDTEDFGNESSTKITAAPTTKPTAFPSTSNRTSAPHQSVEVNVKASTPRQPQAPLSFNIKDSSAPSPELPKSKTPKPKPTNKSKISNKPEHTNPQQLQQLPRLPTVPPRDITDYFRPKTNPAPPPPPPPAPPSSSSSESPDPLARIHTSSIDSLRGKTIIVKRRSQPSSLVRTESHASSDDDSDGESEDNDPKSQFPGSGRGGQPRHPAVRKARQRRDEVPDSEDEKKVAKGQKGSEMDVDPVQPAMAHSLRKRGNRGMDGVEDSDDDDDDDDDGSSLAGSPASESLGLTIVLR